jgi:hypothetical protein
MVLPRSYEAGIRCRGCEARVSCRFSEGASGEWSSRRPLSLRLDRNTATVWMSQLPPPRCIPGERHAVERGKERRRVWGEHLRRRSQARPGTPSPVQSYMRSGSIRCHSHALASRLRLRPSRVRFPSGNLACTRALRGRKGGLRGTGGAGFGQGVPDAALHTGLGPQGEREPQG